MTDCFVGIDTSNYTTSAALCTADGRVIANIKAPLPVKEGECGLRQSDAVFAHVKNLPDVMAQLREALAEKRVLAVGCSVRPRDAEGSYMPCFLVGKAAAEAMAAPLGVPVIDFSHQNGHIMAAAYSCGAMDRLLTTDFAAFHVSGGTTEVLHIKPQALGFSVTLVGETKDLNAGQAIDRIGVMMGLKFPCGKELEALAAQNTRMIPKPRICVQNGCCNLSGLQNLAEKLLRETEDRAAVAAYVLSFLGETLRAMTVQLDEKYPCLPVVYAGGVMSNRYLQGVLSQRTDTYFAEPLFSADNAAGIALLCRQRYLIDQYNQ
ncbi:MAG: peptidase M22 [Clostridia bacterium]|nr:peptidase M22 [Clostridia bacterium]